MGHTRAPASARALRRVLPVLNAVLMMLVTPGCQKCKVMRVNDGRAYCGREIEPEAYSAYARGQLAELQGNREQATREYERVLEFDDQAAEAWVRLAALECRRDPKAAQHGWDKAEERAEDSHLLWFERARCALDSGNLQGADVFARRALLLGPADTQTTLLAARIAGRLGDAERETTLLFGALAVQPGNVALWKALATSSTVPENFRKYAVQRVLQIHPLDETWVPPAFLQTTRQDPMRKLTIQHLREQLPLALARRDARLALRTASLLGVPPDQLALAALDAGFYSLASDQARVLLGLDADDGSAWSIAVLAADLSRSEARLHELLAHPPRQPLPLDGTLSTALLQLVRRVALP